MVSGIAAILILLAPVHWPAGERRFPGEALDTAAAPSLSSPKGEDIG